MSNEQCRLITKAQWDEYQELRKALLAVHYQTSAIGGNEKEMREALLKIDEICCIVFDCEIDEVLK